MNKQNFIIFSVLLFFGCNNIFAELNEFGISNIVPSHADDNTIFDQRISEEMTNDGLKLSSRHTNSLTSQSILYFIAHIKAYFNNLLNTNDKSPDDLELAKLAIIDVEKAKKMLKPQDITPQEAHDVRNAFNSIKTKINAYTHTDNIEGSSYIRP
jgi:hypothetical protein